MERYFDHNASSLLRPEAAEALAAWIRSGGGNPSSSHARGQKARLALEDARAAVASLATGARARDVVFTSGATESVNTVMRAVAAADPEAVHVVSTIEHACIVRTADELEANGRRVLRLAARSDSSLDLEPLAALPRDATCFVSLALANGETGAVLDAAALRRAAPPTAWIHLDVAQAAGRMPLSFGDGIDALSLSGHKFGAPPGVGALLLAPRLRERLSPLLAGGPQEWGLRAGTPNLPGIVAMGAAAFASLRAIERDAVRLASLRERLWSGLAARLSGLRRLSPECGLANTLTVSLRDCRSDSLLAALDLAGFHASAGSACAAGAPGPSRVARALGLEEEWQQGILRLSMGWSSTEAGVDALVEALVGIASRAREAA